MAIKAIVLRAAGTNCDYETGHALEKAGFTAENVHINELLNAGKKLTDYRLLAIPGGFSAGDYLGSGKVYANKLLYKLAGKVPEFISDGNLTIGICNGFQVMAKAGILPGFKGNYTRQLVSLTLNNPLGFQCRWVKLRKRETKCAFTSQGLEELEVPIAHGEGQFITKDKETLEKLYTNRQIVFNYQENPNGSTDSIAGICDETGRVLGMMPHPERNLYSINNPNTKNSNNEEGQGTQVFRNAYNYLKK